MLSGERSLRKSDLSLQRRPNRSLTLTLRHSTLLPMSDTVIRVENISKLYRLGEVGTGSLAHDVNRWWHRVRGKEDPYLKIGEVNDRTKPVAGAQKRNLTTEDTESTEGTAGLRLGGQAGAEFPNPSTSELARDSENTSLIRSANDSRASGEQTGSDSESVLIRDIRGKKSSSEAPDTSYSPQRRRHLCHPWPHDSLELKSETPGKAGGLKIGAAQSGLF